MCFAGTFLLGFIGLFTTGNQWLVIWQLALALLPQPICENSRTSKLSQIKVSNRLFWLMLQKSIAVNDPEPHPNQQEVRGQRQKDIQAVGASLPAVAPRNGRGGACKAVLQPCHQGQLICPTVFFRVQKDSGPNQTTRMRSGRAAKQKLTSTRPPPLGLL